MAIDLIKSYLVGIGFQVDENSFNQTQNSMNEADRTINKFNKNSQDGFSNTGDVLKDFFSLLNSSSGTLGKLFPELQGPFKSFIRDIGLVKKLYSDLTKQIETPQRDIDVQPNQENKNTRKNNDNSNSTSNAVSTVSQNTELTDSSKNLVEQILNVRNASEGLAEEGGSAFKLFSIESLGPIAAVVAGVAVAVLAISGLTKYLNELANQDIEYEKLSRQLWTTKENAKEVDMALKTMGVTMQDLWLSPTLLKQFNQLRKDSAALKLPKEYTDNLKVVQGIGLEFKRLKQLGTLAFQWIGNYILKYAAGPLKEFKQGLNSFNSWLISNIPMIGKIVGSTIGIIIRLLLLLASPIKSLIDDISYFIDLFKLGINSMPAPLKKIIEILLLLSALIIAGPVGAVIALIAIFDDLFTYLKGGKSLTGTFIDKFTKGIGNLEQKIKSVIDWFKNLKKEILNSDFAKWFESVGEGIKKDIDDFKKGNFKDLLGNISVKVTDFSNPNINKVVSSYATSNTSNVSKTTTQNSHNNVKNENTFNVYGGNDANSTGKTVKNHVNGITQRNLQGVY